MLTMLRVGQTLVNLVRPPHAAWVGVPRRSADGLKVSDVMPRKRRLSTERVALLEDSTNS